MRYSIVTFGCRVNQADSFQIEEQLIAAGGAASSAQDADLVVVNTCSVTGSADQGARQIIRKIARENPHARIVVTGCYATRRPDEVADLPGVAQLVPNDRKDHLVAEIGLAAPKPEWAKAGLTTAQRFGDGEGACGADIAPGLAGRTAFTLRVQTGCDQTCSYCIIPTTRGTGRSKPMHEVLSEVARVGDAGYREIAITGVHLGSYGRDLGDGSIAAGAIEEYRAARARHPVSHQLSRADGLFGRHRRSRRCIDMLRAAFSPPAPARERLDARRHAPPVCVGLLPQAH